MQKYIHIHIEAYILGNTHILKAARTAISTALHDIITIATIYRVLNITFNLVWSVLVLNARLHRLILKGKLGQVIGLFIEGTPYM